MPTSESMTQYVTDKLENLGKKYSWVISADVHFEHVNTPKGKDKGKVCKMELSLPGPRIFATSEEEKYEEAVKRTIKDLEVQLKKRKETYKTH